LINSQAVEPEAQSEEKKEENESDNHLFIAFQSVGPAKENLRKDDARYGAEEQEVLDWVSN